MMSPQMMSHQEPNNMAKSTKTMSMTTVLFRVVEVLINIVLIGLAGIWCTEKQNCPLDFITHYDVEGLLYVLIVVCIGALVSMGYLIASCGRVYDNTNHAGEIAAMVGMFILMLIAAIVETYYAAHFNYRHGVIWQATKQPQFIAAAVLTWANSFLYCIDACYLCIGGRVTLN